MKRLIKKSHFDNVPAIRFLLFFLIFLSHSIVTFSQDLQVSVLYRDLKQFTSNFEQVAYSMIFILTGFLNTWSIFEERFIYKRVNMLRYGMRRAISYLPLFVIALILGAFIMPMILYPKIAQPILADGYFVPFFLMLNNYFHVSTSNPYLMVTENLWSVAVCMQFVIVWPAFMNFFRRRETYLFGLMIFIFLIFNFLFPEVPAKKYYIFYYLPEFAVGAYLGYISFFKYPSYEKIKSHTRRTVSFTYLFFFLYFLFRTQIHNKLEIVPQSIILAAEKIAIALTLGYFLFEQNFNSKSLLKAAKIKILHFSGKLSYSMFIYFPVSILISFILSDFFFDKESNYIILLFRPLASLLITIVISALSFEFIEKKFVRLRKNYQPTREYNPSGIQDVAPKNT
jgi:peptidoglycan/LPS O-acetylase OafA/YrhL